MIIDPRTGSGELKSPLARQGCPAELGHLEYGDVAFVGNGPEGCPVSVGIEVKKVSDVLKCIIDGRFAGRQLPGLVQTYAFPWLLVEGKYRPDMHSGVLQISGNKGYWHDACIGGRRYMYRELANWLTTMEIRGGIRVLRTNDRIETVTALANLYHWWTDKSFDEHRSHLVFDESGAAPKFSNPSLTRRVAKELPNIGWEKSAAVADHFGSVVEMVCAPESEWLQIAGVGKTIAQRINKALGGR